MCEGEDGGVSMLLVVMIVMVIVIGSGIREYERCI